MARAGTLDFSGVAVGVSAQEIVDIALANVGKGWTGSPAGFAWGISNLAGLPFFDLRDFTDGPANVFTNPDHYDEGFENGSPALKYESPHQWNDNTNGDGWQTVWRDTNNARASDIASILRPGDIVRVYDYGNESEHSEPECGDINSHSFIVVSVAGGKIEVVDTWGDGKVVKHNWTDIVQEMTKYGKFESAYVSRIIDDYVADHVPDTLQGNGYGDWSGIGSDLEIAAVPMLTAVPGSNGQTFNFTYRVDNFGTLAAAASKTGLYLSTDSTITTADRLLTSDNVARILAGGSSAETGTFKLPTGLAAGTYYVGVITDYGNLICELDETNNVSPGVRITLGADLDVTAAPRLTIAQGGAGQTFNFTYRVDNFGSIAAAASKTGIYLSTDSTITSADRLLAVDDVAGILAGGFRAESGTFTLPAGIAAGNYYIGVITDYDKAIGELNEANNASPGVRITIGSDLDVGAAPVLTVVPGSSGQKFNVTYRVDNFGATVAPVSKTGIYLSTDSTITTADRLLLVDDVASILAGGYRSESGTFILPTSLAAGTYYIGAITDYANSIGELNETNNGSPGVRITIGSDLDVRAAPTLKAVWAAAGSTFNVTYRVDNFGVTAAPASKTGIYLSTDSIITTADRLVAVDDVASILAGAYRTEGGAFNLPGNIAAGNYYIGVIADFNNSVGERNETNNPSPVTRITIFTNGADKITVPTGEKAWHGLGGNDTLTGSSARDALYGDGGDDSLIGGGGNDSLIGGAGHDVLVGGGGADYFQFDSAIEIGRSAGSRDVIKDWDATADYIDLRKIDANSTTGANDRFAFVAAEGSSFSGIKGELRWVQDNNTGSANDRTLVMGDLDGNKIADFIIEINGLQTMRAVDFLL